MRKGLLLAWMILGLASPAVACQLVCVKTIQKYDGNLGGLAGADAKCAAEYPGFKFARNISFPANAIKSSHHSLLYGSRVHSNVGSTMNCSVWTSASNAQQGSTISWTDMSMGTLALQSIYVDCRMLYPLACCNM